ncbi:Tat proofreading chaperone DmsD [Citrobacter telavivensis]
MNYLSQHDAFAATARVLGALFYYAPDSQQASSLVSALTNTEWFEHWHLPKEVLLPLATEFRVESDESLTQAWQRLFIGPWALPAPPWGSVWLDRENVLFGDSTLALRQWMDVNCITFVVQQNEPEDHFGLLLLQVAWLAEQERHNECEQLLALHLMPWAIRFLSVFIDNSEHPFYSALGKLALKTLIFWRAQLLIPVSGKKLFR